MLLNCPYLIHICFCFLLSHKPKLYGLKYGRLSVPVWPRKEHGRSGIPLIKINFIIWFVAGIYISKGFKITHIQLIQIIFFAHFYYPVIVSVVFSAFSRFLSFFSTSLRSLPSSSISFKIPSISPSLNSSAAISLIDLSSS